MDEEKQSQRFKKLIKKGFDIEDISFEYGIPIESLKKWKQELEGERIVTPKKQSPYNESSLKKMHQMRWRYRQLLETKTTNNSKEQKDCSQQKPLSQVEIAEMEETIAIIEQKVQEIKDGPNSEKRAKAIGLVEQIQKFKKYEYLPLETSQRLKNAVYTLDISRKSSEDRLFMAIKNAKLMATNKLVQAISIEQENTTDINKLEELYRKLTKDMERISGIAVGSLRSQIQRKISDIQKQNAMNRIKNNIPQSILDIIDNLARGELNTEEANLIIEEEAKKRLASKSHGRFSVTEEQERRQIFIQIRTAIMENADKYIIKNPEKAIMQMQELFRGEEGESIRAVVTNLIERKQFASAKIICSRISGAQNNQYVQSILRRLQEEIKKAEISDLVLKAINLQTSPEQDARNFESLEVGMRKTEIQPRFILLGKSQDGKKEITLEDIWPERDGQQAKGINR